MSSDYQQGLPAERSLQWNIAALTAYGTLLLGMGQRDPTLPTLSIFAAVTSILFTDQYRWFRLPRSLGNFAALVALAVCMFDFFQERERQLLAIAHLLVYLQVILLYQQKSPRVYWQLIVLSLLQVVVAAALNEHINFGILLVGYLFTSLMAISRLFILRESLRAAQSPVVVVGPTHPALAGAAAQSEAASYIRPLLATNRSEQAAAIRAVRTMLGWPWAGELAIFCAGTLLAASLFFFMTPRLSTESWEADVGGASVGFNPNDVRLRDLNQIQQSESVVMRVRLVDTTTERPLPPTTELFWRGAVKSSYRRDGSWSNSRITEIRDETRLSPPPVNASLVRQEVTLEPTDHKYLFHASPVYQTPEESETLRVYPHILELQTEQRPRGEFRYAVLTDAFQGSNQRTLVPQYAGFSSTRDSDSFQRMLAIEMLAFSPLRNPAVAQIASEEVARLGPQSSDRYLVAKTLEAYFTEPGRFDYTLDPQVSRIAAGRDAIEVFLTEVRSGHCEYFASALALMLRSQGIPSRLVIGYYGGEFNKVGGYYVVKEKFAHAWVEAYLRPGDIPPGMLPLSADTSRGAWLRLNPTPEGIAEAEIERTAFTRITETFDYVQMLWREYVLNLNAERQFERIYQPLATRTQAFIAQLRTLGNNLTDQQAWNRALEGAAARVGIDIHGQLRRIHWFYWPAGLVIIGLGVVGIVILKLGKKVQQTILPTAADQREPVPMFYSRLERLARKHQLVRSEGETPHELAARMQQLLEAAPATVAAACIPQQVVEALYRVRFSGRPLDKPEAQAIERAMVQLGSALRKLRGDSAS